MNLQLVTPPAEAPVSVTEAKSHIRLALGITADDTDVGRYIDAATGLLEGFANRAFVNRTLDLVFDEEPEGGVIELPTAPIASVTGVYLTPDEGEEVTVDAAVYRSSLTSGRVALRRGAVWPVVGSSLAEMDAWRVRFVAGYGGADDVPEPIRQAILLQVAEWYENRGDDPSAGATGSGGAMQLTLGKAAEGVIVGASLRRYVL